MFQCEVFVTMEEKVNSEFHIIWTSEGVKEGDCYLRGEKKSYQQFTSTLIRLWDTGLGLTSLPMVSSSQLSTLWMMKNP